MALNIYTNTMSITAHSKLGVSNNAMAGSIEKLSSGLRINHASDDASGMSISEKLRGQIKGMARASMNAQDAISFLQTAEGALEMISDMVHRMRELAVQAGNAGYTANDRRELQKEVDSLKAEIDRTALSTEFNTQKLLSGSTSAVWSASTNEIEALMTGQPVAEGNYRLDFQVDPGKNAVYKSNILLDNAVYERELSQALNPFGNIAYETTNTIVIESSGGYTLPAYMAFENGTFAGNVKFNGGNPAAKQLFDGYVGDADYASNNDIATITIIDGDGSNSLLPISSYGYEAHWGANVQTYLLKPDGTIVSSAPNIDGMQREVDNPPYNGIDKDGNPVRTGTLVINKNSSGKYDIAVHANGYIWKTELATIPNNNRTELICDEGGTSFWMDISESVPGTVADGSTIVTHFIVSNTDDTVRLVPGKWAIIDYNDVDMEGASTIQPSIRQKFVYMPKVTDPSSGEDVYRLSGVDIGADGTLQQYDMFISDTGVGTFKLKAKPEEYLPLVPTAVIKVEDQINRNKFIAIADDGTAKNAGIIDVQASGDAETVYGAKVNFADSARLDEAALLNTYTSAGASSYVDTLDSTLISAVDSSASGYLEINFKEDATATDGNVLNTEFTFVDALTGQRSSINITKDLLVGTAFDLDFKNGVKIQLDFQENTVENAIKAGDKMLFSITGNKMPQSADDTYAAITLLDGTTGPEVLIDNGKLAGTATTLTAVSLSKDGKFAIANLHWKVGAEGLKDSEFGLTGVPGIREDEILGGIKLRDLSVFKDNDGRMLLDNTQVITIYGNDKEVDIAIEGSDTLANLRDKISNALMYDLDMGGNGIIPGDLVKLVTEAGTGNFSVLGTLVLQTAMVGKQSELKFSGDENVLNALGFAQIQNSRESEVHVTVTNAHNNAFVGEDIVNDRMLRGIIGGVDVKIDSRVGLNASLDQATGEMRFSANHGEMAYLHVVNRQTDVQVGANEGIKLNISIARVDTAALEIADLYLLTKDDAHKSITKLELALERVNRVRSQIGAQVNRMEDAMRNLATSGQNLVAAQSRIKDLDVAEESMNFAKNQVLVNAAVAMLAQANQQPQMAMQLINGR